MLARAFEDDPVFAFVFPDESTRLRGIEHLHRRVSVPDALGDDECYTTTDLAGVALWTQVGKGRMGLVDNLRPAPTVARIFGRHTARALRVFSYLDSHYPEQPHAHLMFLGTEPERQGQGIGSRLLRRTLSGLDQIGAPAYLEATTLRNRALYLGHGFVALGQLNLPGGGPPL